MNALRNNNTTAALFLSTDVDMDYFQHGLRMMSRQHQHAEGNEYGRSPNKSPAKNELPSANTTLPPCEITPLQHHTEGTLQICTATSPPNNVREDPTPVPSGPIPTRRLYKKTRLAENRIYVKPEVLTWTRESTYVIQMQAVGRLPTDIRAARRSAPYTTHTISPPSLPPQL